MDETGIVFDGVVGRVKVVRESRELGSDGINLLDEGRDTVLLAESTHGELGGAHAVGQLTVGETELLGLTEDLRCDGRDIVFAAQK